MVVHQEEPLSIHLPGVKQQAEKTEAKQKEAAVWQSRLVVEDTAQHFHRLLPQTEMTSSGFYSSNQVGWRVCGCCLLYTSDAADDC